MRFMDVPIWALSDGSMFRDGILQPLSVIFEELDRNSGSALREDVPGVRFSRAALNCRFRFSGRFPHGIRLETGLLKNGQFFACNLDRDQCVIANTWHPIEPFSRKRVLDALARHQVSDGEISVGKYFQLSCDGDSLDLAIDEIEDAVDGAWLSIDDVERVPRGLVGTLYPYQQTGSGFLRTLARNDMGALLADEMGLGKTIQAITLILDLPVGSQTLVVAPGSLIPNWIKELNEFAPGLTHLRHAGPTRTGVASGLRGFDVIISSYDTVANDLSFLSDVQWDLLVIDEAQQIRNPDSRRATAVKSIPRRISLAVTGTPVENTLRDLWSIGEFVIPQLLGGRSEFESRFPDEAEAAHRLGRIVAPVTLRRKVSDVASDLPERVEIRTPLELSESNQREYQAIEASGNRFTTDVPLRVLCAHALEGETGAQSFTSEPKVVHLCSIIEEIFENDEKALVFASFQLTLDRLWDVLRSSRAHGFIEVIDGRTDAGDRQGIIDLFSDHRGPGCLLLNPRAAGVGLNITAANHVIHFNPEYNPAVTEQATARAYRRKQERTVFVHHLYYEGTIEEGAMVIADDKRELASSVDLGVKTSDEDAGR
jgi:SNF2 family DNA or RNA helicase